MKAGGLLYFLKKNCVYRQGPCTGHVNLGALRKYAEGTGFSVFNSALHPCRSCLHSSRLTASANQPMDGMRSIAWP